MAVITIVLAVIGFFGVRYARRTLRAVESQGSIMQGQLAIMQEETTAVIKSAEAAKLSADAFINADRAWLHAEVITDTPERKLVPTSTQYPVAVTNYGRTVGEITGYRVSGGRLDRIDELLSDRGQMISLGNNGRRFLAPGRSENVFPFDIKQVFEYCGLWEDIGRSRVTGVIVIEIRYCDVLDRKAQHLSRFVYSYDSDVIKLSLLPEYTEYT
jgi:hypothetical protein